MTINTQMRNERVETRLRRQDDFTALVNTMVDGNGCSSFEAEIVNRNETEGVLRSGDCGSDAPFQPG